MARLSSGSNLYRSNMKPARMCDPAFFSFRESQTMKMKSFMKRIFKYLAILLLAALTFVTILSFKPIPATVKPIQANENTRFWKMKTGYRIAYQRHAGQDSQSLAPIIFLHGCMTVLIGGLPAARVGDMAACAGPPISLPWVRSRS